MTVQVENRVTLILKTLCGLSVPAIAGALLTTESTINKRLYRTRQALHDAHFELPSESERPAALDTVHTALYLLFNEGYLSTGEKPVAAVLANLYTRAGADEPARRFLNEALARATPHERELIALQIGRHGH